MQQLLILGWEIESQTLSGWKNLIKRESWNHQLTILCDKLRE